MDHDPRRQPLDRLCNRLHSLAFIDCIGPIAAFDYTIFKQLSKLHFSSSTSSLSKHHLHPLKLPHQLHTLDTVHFAQRDSHLQTDSPTEVARRLPEGLHNLSYRWSTYANLSEHMPHLVRLKIDEYDADLETPRMWEEIGPRLECLMFTCPSTKRRIIPVEKLEYLLKLCRRLDTFSLCGYAQKSLRFLTYAKQLKTLVFNPPTPLRRFDDVHLPKLKQMKNLRVLDLTGAFESMIDIHWLSSLKQLREVVLAFIDIQHLFAHMSDFSKSSLTYLNLNYCRPAFHSTEFKHFRAIPKLQLLAAEPATKVHYHVHRHVSDMQLRVQAHFHYRAYGGTFHPEYEVMCWQQR